MTLHDGNPRARHGIAMTDITLEALAETYRTLIADLAEMSLRELRVPACKLSPLLLNKHNWKVTLDQGGSFLCRPVTADGNPPPVPENRFYYCSLRNGIDIPAELLDKSGDPLEDGITELMMQDLLERYRARNH